MSYFFTADLHIDDARALKHPKMRRDFSSVEDMNSHIMNEINSRCTEEDHLFIMGNVTVSPVERLIEICSDIKANVHLISGHLDPTWKTNKDYISQFNRLSISGFKSIRTYGVLKLSEEFFLNLSHLPYEGTEYTEYDGENLPSDCRPKNYDLYNLCGHVYSEFTVKNKNVNVGLDINNMSIFSLKEVIEVIKSDM